MPELPALHVIGGGTVSHIRSHFALTAVAYGETARTIHRLLAERGVPSALHLTKMACAGQSPLETNKDVSDLVDRITADNASRVIFFNPAIVDFEGQIGDVASGKYATRLKSREPLPGPLQLTPSDKIVGHIKERRPDMILVAFKTTAGVAYDEQLARGQALVDGTGADFVVANDTVTRRNILIGRNGQILCDTTDRHDALEHLVDAVLETLRASTPAPVRTCPPRPEAPHA